MAHARHDTTLALVGRIFRCGPVPTYVRPLWNRRRVQTSRGDDLFLRQLRHLELLHAEQLDVLQRSGRVEELDNVTTPFAIRVLRHASKARHPLHDVAIDGRERLAPSHERGPRPLDL